MRLHIGHPHVAHEGGEKAHGNKHHDELILLAVLMLTPVVLSLPPITLTILLRWVLWALVGICVALVVFLAHAVGSWPKPRTVLPMRAVAFQPDLVPKELDTIVIGSGSGGSTCSNLLAQSGQRVLVLEQHPTVTGGCTHSFREQNCKFTTCSMLDLFQVV